MKIRITRVCHQDNLCGVEVEYESDQSTNQEALTAVLIALKGAIAGGVTIEATPE